MGYDEAAQHVSIERRVRERYADGTKWLNWLTNRLLHLVADYGYRPWKTVAWSIGVIVFCAALFALGERLCGTSLNGQCNGHPAFVQTRFADFERDKEKTGYPPFNALYHSLDQFVPLLDLGMEGYWRANPQAVVSFDVVRLRMVTAPEPGSFPVRLPLGSFLYFIGVVQTILGSILLAITITGFTGLLTRDDR